MPSRSMERCCDARPEDAASRNPRCAWVRFGQDGKLIETAAMTDEAVGARNTSID